MTRFSKVFHTHKGNTTCFGINNLNSDDTKLWNQFYFELLNKETNLTKSKFKPLLIFFLKNILLIDHYLLLF